MVCGAEEDYNAGRLRNNAWQKDMGRKIEQIAFSPFSAHIFLPGRRDRWP